MIELADLAPRVAAACPFRLGTTSYIIPDEILPNVRFLAPLVDDVELVLFESEDVSNLPDAATIAALAELAEQHGLTYTVHLPLDMNLGDLDERKRRNSVRKCLRVRDVVAGLEPFAYAVHFDGAQKEDAPAAEVGQWRQALRRSAIELIEAGFAASSLCVETLDYDYRLIEDLVREQGMSVCLDVGHIVVQGGDVNAMYAKYQKDIRIVHLHGVRDGRDHRDAGALPDSIFRGLMQGLCQAGAPEKVVSLEVFNYADFAASVSALAEWAGVER